MPFGGESVIVGSYTVTWNSVALGLMVGEEGVPTIVQVVRSKKIDRTDKYGDTKIDSIHRGADYTFECVLMEYTKGIAPLWPFSTFGRLGTIGVLKYTLSQALVLTAVAGTSAATSPATLTSSKSILADDHQGKLQFGPQVREVPLKMDMFPYEVASGVAGHFTTT